MSPGALLWREIRLRWLNFVLALLAVAAATALFVTLSSLGRASNIETKRLMRDLGFNVLILPQGADLAEYWASDTVRGEMPEAYVQKLAQTKGIGADHYVATIQRRFTHEGVEVLLTGVLPERNAVDAPGKEPMGYEVKRGECYVGFAVARALGLEEQSKLALPGATLTVARVMVEDGSKEDARVYTHLADAQRVLKMPGRINSIQALGCLCYGAPIAILRERIAKVLPDTYVTELRNIAVVRAETRQMVEQHVELIVMAAVAVCALWVALLAWLNVRERRTEIGLLRALGFGSGHVAGLFLSRAALIGLLGALLGFGIGVWLAMHFGADVFKITFAKVKPPLDLLPRTVIAAMAVTVLATVVPAMAAVTQDPAAILREEQ